MECYCIKEYGILMGEVIVGIWIVTALVQSLLLWGLWRGARDYILQKIGNKAPEVSVLLAERDRPLPRVAMIIPAAGKHPVMERALRSLLCQDYPHILPVISTAYEDDAATVLVRSLQAEFPQLECVVAGEAQGCGQKNHNILRAVEYVGKRADIYMFCDSTHIAKPDFVRQLAWPIVNGEAGFSTGYHDVMACDDKIVTLGYQISVLLMRFLQVVAVFTQPWGGAMAIARGVFEHHAIAAYWRTNVVDDCSLAAFLLQRRLHVQLCPYAILTTEVQDHSYSVWRAWMARQILFLKFCVMPQWYLLGLLVVLLVLPVCMSFLCILGGCVGLLSFGTAWYVCVALLHLGVLGAICLVWRELLPRKPAAVQWLFGFATGVSMFFTVYMCTVRSWSIDWHGIRYHVAPGGRVLTMKKIEKTT